MHERNLDPDDADPVRPVVHVAPRSMGAAMLTPLAIAAFNRERGQESGCSELPPPREPIEAHTEITLTAEQGRALLESTYPDQLDKIIDAPPHMLTAEQLEAQRYAHRLISEGVVTFRRKGEEFQALTPDVLERFDADAKAQLQRALRAGVKSELAKWLERRDAQRTRDKLERRSKRDGDRKARKAKRHMQKSSRKRNRS